MQKIQKIDDIKDVFYYYNIPLPENFEEMTEQEKKDYFIKCILEGLVL